MQTSRNELRKVCPQCSTPVHVKKAVCECGYAFPSKRKAQSDNMLRAMKHKRVDRLHKANMRASETHDQTVNRQKQSRARMASMRASETHDQTVNRQKQSRAHMASMRASEAHEQAVNRQTQSRAHMASMRASETHEQTVNRQKQSRVHMASMRASETHEQTVNRQKQSRVHMASMRASETHEQTVNRQKQSRVHMASMRASETHEQTVNRQEQDKLCKSSMRASETHEQTVNRQEQDKLCMRASERHDQTVNRQEQDKLRKARKRASETPVQVLQRQETNKERMLCKRSKCVSVEQAICAFHSEIKASKEIICVAPAEGEKPLNIMTDSNFEAMSNPDKFPFANGTFSSERPKKLTYRKYSNQRLLDVDGRFARDLDYLFVAQYIVEAKQVLDDGNNFAWRQKPSRQFTAAQARDQTLLSQYVRKDKAYSFMKTIRGSPPYYQRTFYDLLAMIRQLGTPTWFFTLSAADLKWPDMIQTIARQYGVYYTDDEVAVLSFDEKSNWLKRNPVTAARHFHYRLNVFFQDFLKSIAKPLGEIADYAIRIEFQARGSPHAHCVIWVKDAPEFGVDNNDDVCDFIDQYVSCKVPAEDGKLKDIVLLLHKHKHSSYCRRNKTCRFSFPKPPSSKTLIAKDDPERGDNNQELSVLRKVQKLIADSNTDLSLAELLDKAEVTKKDYIDALEVSTNGNVVVLKREPNECFINNYNPSVMLAWQANMDIQFVPNAYACIMYVASYIMKTERSMGELLKRVAAEARTDELKSQLRKVGSAFLTHREVSAQEAVYRILSLPMKQLSRSVLC